MKSQSRFLSKNLLTQSKNLTAKSLTKLVEKAVKQTLAQLKLGRKLSRKEVSILICDDKFIQNINAQTRKKNNPTNVLSFPFMEFNEGKFISEDEYSNIFGEIILSFEKCAEEAFEQGKSVEDHITHLIIHSVLHLLGFDHELEKQAKKMENLEIKILKERFSIANPYA